MKAGSSKYTFVSVARVTATTSTYAIPPGKSSRSQMVAG